MGRKKGKKDEVVFKLYYGGGAGGSQSESAQDSNNSQPGGFKLTEENLKARDEKDDGEDKYGSVEESEGDEEIEEEEGDEEFDDDIDYNDDKQAANSHNKRKNEDIDDDEFAWGSDDEYDYRQHIRESGRGVFVAADADYTEKVLNSLNMGHKVRKLREMAGRQYVDVDDYADKDVDAALFVTGTLDDDFVAQANGGAPVDEPEMERLKKSMKRLKLRGQAAAGQAHGVGGRGDFGEFDFEGDGEYDDDDEDYDDDYDVDAARYHGYQGAADGERKPRFIDEQFDHVLEQYDESNIGEWMDPRDPEVMGRHEADVDDPIFQEYIQDRLRRKGPNQTASSFANIDQQAEAAAASGNKENQAPTTAARYESDAEYSDDDPFSKLYPAKKEEQWDCDTVISTYSNLENHPKLIVEASNKIKLSKKTGMPIGVLAGRQKQPIPESESESEEEDGPVENAGKARSRNETPEERKERKKQIKEAKKTSREKKKLVKQAYKSEEIKQTNIMVTQRVHQRVVYKF